MATEKVSARDPTRIGMGKPGPGRKKGVPNHLTADVRAMIHEALSDAGGTEYLVEQARENPRAFLALVGRVVPAHVTLEASVTLAQLVGRSMDTDNARALDGVES